MTLDLVVLHLCHLVTMGPQAGRERSSVEAILPCSPSSRALAWFSVADLDWVLTGAWKREKRESGFHVSRCDLTSSQANFDGLEPCSSSSVS